MCDEPPEHPIGCGVEGEIGRAFTLAEQTERDAHSGGDRVTEAAVQILRPRAFFQRGDFSGCAAILQQVRRAIEKFHLSADLPRLWRIAHANLNRALGRLDLAAGDLEARQAASAARSMLREHTAPQSRITALTPAARWAEPLLVAAASASALAPSPR